MWMVALPWSHDPTVIQRRCRFCLSPSYLTSRQRSLVRLPLGPDPALRADPRHDHAAGRAGLRFDRRRARSSPPAGPTATRSPADATTSCFPRVAGTLPPGRDTRAAREAGPAEFCLARRVQHAAGSWNELSLLVLSATGLRRDRDFGFEPRAVTASVPAPTRHTGGTGTAPRPGEAAQSTER